MPDVSYNTPVNPLTPVVIRLMYIKTVDDITPVRTKHSCFRLLSTGVKCGMLNLM